MTNNNSPSSSETFNPEDAKRQIGDILGHIIGEYELRVHMLGAWLESAHKKLEEHRTYLRQYLRNEEDLLNEEEKHQFLELQQKLFSSHPTEEESTPATVKPRKRRGPAKPKGKKGGKESSDSSSDPE